MAEIRRIEVDKLFGLYDHRIDLHPEEHITLLHGPNGVGKTALLRLLNALINGNYGLLRSVPFSEFRVYFTDNRWIRVKQEGQALEVDLFADAHFGMQIDVFRGEKLLLADKGTVLNPQLEAYVANLLPDYVPSIRRMSSGRWMLRNSKQYLTTEEAVRYVLNSEYVNDLPISHSVFQELQKFLRSQPLTELLGDTKAYLIGTNRLLPPSKTSRRRVNIPAVSRGEELAEEAPKSAIQHHANVIRDVIAAALAQYSSVSAQRDRTFPERLVHGQAEQVILSDDELRDRFAKLEKRRNRLESAGLLDAQAAGRPFTMPDSLNETTLSVLSVYVEDTEQKLAVFDDVEARITLLKQIVEKRFLRTKRFSIDQKKGFVFHVGDQEIELEQLSSGEQHELAVFCELLFTVPDGSYILIDEPELSLHVTWQLEFLTDLQAVTRIRPMEILIATHSPWIINEHWNLTAELNSGDFEEPETLTDGDTQSRVKLTA